MKKLIFPVTFVFPICLICLMYLIHPVFAIDKSRELLDRFATKAAEIAKNYQKPLLGRVISLGAKTIAIKTENNGEKTVYVSEATNYYRFRAGQKTTTDLKSLQKDDYIAALGTLDPATNDLTATQIIAKTKKETLVGEITDRNLPKGLFSLKSLTSPNSPTISLEIELSTPIKIASDGAILKGKYSHLKTAKNLAVTGYYDAETFLPLKILILSSN